MNWFRQLLCVLYTFNLFIFGKLKWYQTSFYQTVISNESYVFLNLSRPSSV